MHAISPRPAERIRAAVAAAALQAALGYALIVGLAGDMPARIEEGLKLFSIFSTPPPAPVVKIVPRRAKAPRREGAASPPNLRAKPTEIVAPPPVVPIFVPPPVVAAPKAGPGDDPSAGAAEVPGPGFGSGGLGTGSGSGAAGNGDGGGGGGRPARWLRGRIHDSDYPPEADQRGIQGSLVTRYVVGADGRVTDCTIVESSGSPILDDTTCRLVRQRYRYKPATDSRGRPVSDIVVEDHSWVIE